MFKKKTIKDVDVQGKTVLLRTDYNVPMQDGKIIDDLRIRASLPTINYLLDHGAAKVIIISHLGRPKGRDDAYSLLPVAKHLKKLLPNSEVFFNYDVAGPEVEKTAKDLPKGSIFLLENLRFWPEEKWNDAAFAKEIVAATGADLFVQDAFGAIHRAHTSTDAITKELPSVAGLLVEKEVTALTKLLDNPQKPFWLVLGGAKVADKQPLIDAFKPIANEAFIGGKIAADGYQPDNPNIHVATEFKTDEQGNKCDISDHAADVLVDYIQNEAKTVLWNGTLGQTEIPAFAQASEKLAEALSAKTAKDESFTSAICGGDTTAFVDSLNTRRVADGLAPLEFTLISTGGGAALALLTGEPLPGLDSLENL